MKLGTASNILAFIACNTINDEISEAIHNAIPTDSYSASVWSIITMTIFIVITARAIRTIVKEIRGWE